MNPVNRILRKVNLQLRRLHPTNDPERAPQFHQMMHEAG